MTFRSVLTPALALFLAFGCSAMSRASSIDIYTFEGPQFTGQSTPFGPIAPNIGDPSFTTYFQDEGDPGGGGIFSGFPSSEFSGQFLADLSDGYLELTFNEPVYAFQVVWAVDDLYFDPFDPFLLLVTYTSPSLLGPPTGGTGQYNQNTAGNEGPYAEGLLSYTSATPFTTVVLAGGDFLFEAPIAIDDVAVSTSAVTGQFSPIPEPSFLPLVGAALAGLVVLRRRWKWRTA